VAANASAQKLIFEKKGKKKKKWVKGTGFSEKRKGHDEVDVHRVFLSVSMSGRKGATIVDRRRESCADFLEAPECRDSEEKKKKKKDERGVLNPDCSTKSEEETSI